MSARVEVEHVYFAYCPDCSTGTDEDGPEDDAQRWAERHNADNHVDPEEP